MTLYEVPVVYHVKIRADTKEDAKAFAERMFDEFVDDLVATLDGVEHVEFGGARTPKIVKEMEWEDCDQECMNCDKDALMRVCRDAGIKCPEF